MWKPARAKVGLVGSPAPPRCGRWGDPGAEHSSLLSTVPAGIAASVLACVILLGGGLALWQPRLTSAGFVGPKGVPAIRSQDMTRCDPGVTQPNGVSMSDFADQTWGWIYQPLRDMRERCRTEPAIPWDERLTRFLDDLGLSSVDQHPVVAALAERVKQEIDAIAFVSADGFESVVYELIVALEPAAVPAQPDSVVVADPAAVADVVVVAIGLPALWALVEARPDLVAGVDLADALARALAYRLTAQAAPEAAEVDIVLADYLEQQIAANPVPAGEFYALFGEDLNLAYQWVTGQLDAHASELPAVAAAVTGGPLEVPAGQTYLMPEMVEHALRKVPGAEALTPEEINEAIREVLAESQGGPS